MRANIIHTRGLDTPTRSQHNICDSEKLSQFYLVLLTGFETQVSGTRVRRSLYQLSHPVTLTDGEKYNTQGIAGPSSHTTDSPHADKRELNVRQLLRFFFFFCKRANFMMCFMKAKGYLSIYDSLWTILTMQHCSRTLELCLSVDPVGHDPSSHGGRQPKRAGTRLPGGLLVLGTIP